MVPLPVLNVARVDAVFDTNIVLEIPTLVDLDRASASSRLMERAVVPWRRNRARASLSAAWLCHVEGLAAQCLRHDVDELLKRKAPARSARSAFPWFFTWFLLDHVLTDWKFCTSEDAAASDLNLGGNARDGLLVSIAKGRNAPLVTHEGKPGGAIDKASKRLGVPVMTASEWIAHRGHDERKLARALLDAAEAAMPRFLITRGDYADDAAVRTCWDYLALLEMILDPTIELKFKDPLDGWRLFG